MLDSSGHELRGVVGPLEEGQKAHLTCRSVGGIPEPTLSWWRDAHRIRQVRFEIDFCVLVTVIYLKQFF